MTEPGLVPDLFEALIGWRCWGLAKTNTGIQLVSRGNIVWPTDQPLTAECALGKAHAAPAETCTCGLYALSKRDGFPYYGYDGATYAVFGEVWLWGDVIRGSKGYRAQHGYPKALYLAHRDWRYVKPLREAYRVPVELHNPYNLTEA